MKQNRKAGRVVDSVITHIVLIVVCFIFFFPCLWLILASFSKSGSIYSFRGFFPTEFSLDTFKKLFTDTSMYNYPKWFLNTLVIALGSCVLGSFLTVLTAYTMSRFDFKSRKTMMKTTMILGMFPSFMGMTAVYLLMTQFGLINRLWGLILIYSAGAPMGRSSGRSICPSPSPCWSIPPSPPSPGPGATLSSPSCCSRRRICTPWQWA